MTFETIIRITAGEVLQMSSPAANVQHLLTDSRRGIFNASSLFFAIAGVRHDGHQFIERLYAQGVRQFVVSCTPEGVFPDANILLVPDTVAALQQIAASHRNSFSLPVVGITGSNGKTIVKEWLAQLWSPHRYVIKSPKSYNSQIGVPLSVWHLQAEHELAIFEAGISQPGEMIRLAEIIRPTLGIFTNIGPAHDEGFQNREQKIREKALLFRHCQTLVYCQDHDEIDRVMQQLYPPQKLYSWSAKGHSAARLHLIATEQGREGMQLQLRLPSEDANFTFHVPFRDEVSLENAMHCIACLLMQGLQADAIQKGLSGLRQVSMRMELKQGINHCYLLDDSYSNDLLGLQMALDFMQQQTPYEKQTVILSDLLQTGQLAEAVYREVNQLLIAKGVQKLVGIGEQMAKFRKVFSEKLSFASYTSTQDFLRQADFSSFRYENILVKGARKFGFEQIVSKLQQKIHSTTLEINLDALTHNLNFYRSQLQPDTRLMVMVKAFSYGGASFEIANLLQYHQVDYLGVAYADEGIMLRENGIRTPVLVMNPSADSFAAIAAYRLEPEIYSLRMLQQFIEESAQWSAIPPIHIKIDTGMHRLGFEPQDLHALTHTLKEAPGLRIASIFSHLAASEEAEHREFTLMQVEKFQEAASLIEASVGYKPLRHILNSAGIMRYPEYQLDMVRLGIGLYGIEPNHWQSQSLRSVSTLKTVISQIKYVRKGETVGYSRKGKAGQDMKIATIAIGYADGFDRGFSNGNALVFVKGLPAPVIGNVCMDMCMIDISSIDAEEGEEVIIFGDEQSVEVLARHIGTIPYEILTNISERVKRIFYTDSF